jgi:methylmalonyl-CoA mutase cobalamin-binding subunit
MIADGILPEYICDVYIPAIARRMGDDWCEDEATFSSVTIGTSRLQFLLREIGPGKSDDLRWNANGDEASLLLLLSRDANHTLGVMVLAGQLRRLGFSVKLSIGESTKALIETMHGSQFDAVFVSASMKDDLDDLRGVVQEIKANSKSPPPIILGGVIVEQDRDALQVTGVDKVTNKLDEALLFCKLHRSTRSA